MPPRTSSAVASSAFNLTSLLQSLPSATRSQALTKCSTCLFSTSVPMEAKHTSRRKTRKHQDPYRLAQARQRKSANLARQKVLQAERSLSLGDPVRSRATPFVDSLQSSTPLSTVKESYLNYFLKPEDVQKSLAYSRWLTEPLAETNPVLGADQKLDEKVMEHAASHANSSKALMAIASLENASSKDRTRVNIQRCIEEFGRHNTDGVLAPGLKNKQSLAIQGEDEVVPKRIGQDTGSSEVQIAILTAKINVLANNLHKKDKSNKRQLRMMVHKRQKLMNYLRKQDRGGPRWQNVVEKLGVNDAMWKGEISL